MASLREAAVSLLATLDRLEIAYAIGGSIASSLHGIARATQDVDLVVDLPASKVARLYDSLSGQYYADSDLMLDAIRRGAGEAFDHM